MAVVNIAHRGARSLAPENTLAAARRGLELGADLWELDVAVSADGGLFLMHDDSMERTTDVRAKFPNKAGRPFTEYTLDEIRTLDAGSRFVETDPYGTIAAGEVPNPDRFRGERVPSLREALEWTRDAGWKVNLELKRLAAPHGEFPVPERVIDLIEDAGVAAERVVLSGARLDWLRRCWQRRPDIESQALLGLLPSDPIDFDGYRWDVYNIRHTRIGEEHVRDLVKRGKRVNLYVVNEEADMRRWAAAGAAAFFTDYPQRLKALAL